MSSPLYAATCLARVGTVAEIELHPTPAIDPHFSISDFYALAILHEAAVDTVYRLPGVPWRRASPPLAHALASHDMIDLSSTDTLARRSLTARFVLRAAYSATRNWQPRLCVVPATGVSRTLPGYRDAAAALRATTKPSAILRIEVTDPSHLAHLEPTMIWDSYAFDDNALAFV